MKNLQLSRPGLILSPSDFIQTCVLTTSQQAFDTPAGAEFVAFSYNADVYVKFGSTAAAVPTTSSTGSSGSELNPNIRDLHSTQATTGLSLIAPVAGGVVTMAWYGPGA